MTAQNTTYIPLESNVLQHVNQIYLHSVNNKHLYDNKFPLTSKQDVQFVR